MIVNRIRGQCGLFALHCSAVQKACLGSQSHRRGWSWIRHWLKPSGPRHQLYSSWYVLYLHSFDCAPWSHRLVNAVCAAAMCNRVASKAFVHAWFVVPFSVEIWFWGFAIWWPYTYMARMMILIVIIYWRVIGHRTGRDLFFMPWLVGFVGRA